ncbi:uncharacterized protein LOC125209125 [Salvia hispanica]|uniref:uncharacterized protein LOC125209125 n=1 Tax=Salvia hispanica TaxID=49212 RepID=UPI0020092386|nr:uncharacterized protein LOC125209125 [Salvia hispanica]
MYVRWVDRLLNTLNSSNNLVKFRVAFSLSSAFTLWIDEWLSYAVNRKVESLDLILGTDLPQDCYSFPYKQGNFPDNLKLLKKLSLHSVIVSGEAVAFMLGNCHLLEQLSVSRIGSLESLKVVQTSPVFKCLEISQCNSLNLVVVRESKVVCIKYDGATNQYCSFTFVDVPLLTQLWIRAKAHNPFVNFTSIISILDMFDYVIPQLHMLKIYATVRLQDEDIIKKLMPKLKELVVVFDSNYCDKWSLMPVISWFRMTPCLQRFVVEAPHQEKNKKCLNSIKCYDCWHLRFYKREYNFGRVNSPIKEIEFVGYRGVLNHFQMITQFVELGAAIDKIIVDPRPFKLRSYMPWDRISQNDTKDEIFARNCAKDQLKHYPRVNIL